jgi:uncharacterized membrane protein
MQGMPELSPAQVVGAISMTVGCLLWVVSYGLIMRKAWIDKAYGYPWIYTCAGFSYEFIQGFVVEPSGEGVIVPLQVAVMRLWFLVDIGLLAQLLVYGPRCQRTEIGRRFFYPATILALLLVGLTELQMLDWFDDRSGHVVGYGVGVLGAFAFVWLACRRPDGAGLSWPAAWTKLVGTLLISIPHVVYYPGIAPGRSYVPMWVMYFLFTAGDVWYLAILWRRRRRATPLPRPGRGAGPASP